MARISFFNWLDLSGIQDTSDPSVKWVYYTHLGKRYRLPIRKLRRGPSRRDEELSMLFQNNRDEESEVRGPLGDYHGMVHEVKQAYGLEMPPSSDIVNPWRHAAEFLFESKSEDVIDFVLKFYQDERVQGSMANIVDKFTRFTAGLYEIMDDEFRQIAYERQSLNPANNLTQSTIDNVNEDIDRYFESVMKIIDMLKARKVASDDYDVVREVCGIAQLPDSLTVFVRDFLITRKINVELFKTAVTDLKEKFGMGHFDDMPEQEVHPPTEDMVIVDDYEETSDHDTRI